MNIIFFASSIIPSKSANSVNVIKIAEAFKRNGHNIELIAFTSDKLSSKDVFNYYGIDTSFPLLLFRTIKTSIKIINRFILLWYAFIVTIIIKYKRPDIVYTRNAIVAFFTSSIFIKTIYHGHGLVNNRLHKYIIKKLGSKKYIKKIAVVSGGLKTIYEKEYGVNTPKLKVISNGVDINGFIDPLQKKEARRILNLSFEDRVLCYCGHLYKGRGIEKILELSRFFSKFKFVIVGGLPKDVEKYKKKSLKNVIFVGHVKNNRVPLYLCSSDYLLMPYQRIVKLYGGGINTGNIIRPLKMFEYMASKRPIIASRLEGLCEVLNENNAILVDPENINDWINAVKKLEDNPDFAHSIANQAYNDVFDFTYDKIIKQIIDK